MKPKQIGEAYDQITHLWQRKEFDRNNGIEQHKKALAFVENKVTALDIGCGCTGRLMDLLIANGFVTTGLDISTEMITLARKYHPEVNFIHNDICKIELQDKFDFITAWDSIWHIPLSEQRAVITKVINMLNVGGVFIFSFGATASADEQCDDTMGTMVYYSTLGTHGFLSLFIELGCVIRHLEFDQYPDIHSYMIIEKA